MLNALACKNSKGPPIWLMRQAGRYLPEYQRLRKERSLVEMFHCKETICQVTKLPLDILDLDAAIVFSDILIVLDGLNIKWGFEEGVGPIIESNVERENLPTKIANFPYTPLVEAIKELKRTLHIPLLGFAGAPFTVASYLIEGRSSRDLLKTKQWLYQDPQSFHRLLEIITDAIIDLLHLQIKAGVDAIQIFDSWAGHLSYDAFQTFCLRYHKKIIEALHSTKIPIILFCKGSSSFAKELASLKPNCISLDWTLPIHSIRQITPSSIALQGNLDPVILFASKEVVKKEAEKILRSMRGDPGFIFNLGHGILPKTPVDNVKVLIETIKSFY